MTHTPGPWTFEYGECNGYDCMSGGWIISGSTHPSGVVTVDEADGPNGEANTHLIAAAPELLEAAKQGLKIAESWAAHDQLDGTSLLADALSELAPIRAAIAKAEGK